MVLPYVPCGHFVLGTLSETYFKDVVFKVNIRQTKLTKISKIPNVKFDMKIKNRIITRYDFGSINTFRYIIQYHVMKFDMILRKFDINLRNKSLTKGSGIFHLTHGRHINMAATDVTIAGICSESRPVFSGTSPRAPKQKNPKNEK